jgi:cytochrome c oxidase subunit 2
MTIKVTGHQWYWSYEYPDKGIAFDSNIVPEAYIDGTASDAVKSDWDQRMEELRVMLGRTEPIKPVRLLDTDTRLVVPVDTTVKVIVTADDVIHSWTMPAFGFKIDAIPGRLNETWFHAREIGTYHGQCSELCGIRHAFMPIVIEVVSKEDYQEWLTRAENFYASNAFPAGPQLADGSTK